jgi:xanthine/uracil/vitamin C permease (AzgA family)
MGTLGVIGCTTTTNHVHEIKRVLGIEATRRSIMDTLFCSHTTAIAPSHYAFSYPTSHCLCMFVVAALFHHRL